MFAMCLPRHHCEGRCGGVSYARKTHEKVPHTPEIQGRIGQQLKAQYDDAGPVPHRLAELLEQLAQLELLKELTQLMDEPDSKGG